MARYRKIDVRVWIDDRFQRLSPIPPCGQGLWLYLLTNPETTNIPGLYRSGEAGMAEALEWPLEAFREAFREASSEGMVKACWKHRVVWIPKAIDYHGPESPNVVRAWRNPWDEIPDCDLKTKAYQTLKDFTEGLGEGFGKAFREALAKPSPNQEQEQEQEQEKKRVPRASRSGTPAPWALTLSDLLIELLRDVPGARIPPGARQRWAREIERMPAEIPELAANGANPTGTRPWWIEAAIRWALGPENLGQEYEVVIRSGKTLREKWPQLRAAAMRKRAKRQPQEEIERWMASGA